MQTGQSTAAPDTVPEAPGPVVLVDGSAYLYRAFHVMERQGRGSGGSLATADGRPTGAIHVMLNMLRKLVTSYRPARMAVVFDASGKTFRDEMYPSTRPTARPCPTTCASRSDRSTS